MSTFSGKRYDQMPCEVNNLKRLVLPMIDLLPCHPLFHVKRCIGMLSSGSSTTEERNMSQLRRLLVIALLALSPLAYAQQNCAAVHNSNLGVCRSEHQSQCAAATNYANRYCAGRSVEDRRKCREYSARRDQRCAQMGNCRRQADAAYRTCLSQQRRR